MKKILFLLFLFINLSMLANAQCDKKLNLTSDEIYMMNADSTKGPQLPGSAEIALSADSIVVSMNLEPMDMSETKGAIIEKSCHMNENYTEGSIDFKSNAVISDNGTARHSALRFHIISKEGKMTIYLIVEEKRKGICFEIKENMKK